jgi:hypothetical protein
VSYTVTWISPPSGTLIPNIERYETHVRNAIHYLADTLAQKMQGEAQSGAPWNDVTGAARQGLLGQAVKAATEVIVYLMHTVFYGVFLELGTSKMAPRPIILPVLQANYPYVMAELRRILAG